jgi:GT2 family glycosyltransferase
MSLPKIVAVVVTYNRLNLLQKCVNALRNQTRPCDAIVIVNNGSTDGTSNWLQEQSDLVVLNQTNQGSAGGQATGAQWALEQGFTWAWLMDDDTIVAADALAAFLSSGYLDDPSTGLLASTIYWRDGSLHVMNKPFPVGYPVIVDFLCDTHRAGFPILSASFVSILVRCDAIRAVGLPLRGTYLWGDDLEFTRRITSRFKGYCVLASKAVHDTPYNSGSTINVNEAPLSLKQYCLIRNMIILPILSRSNAVSKMIICLKKISSFLKECRTIQAAISVLQIGYDAWSFCSANKHFSLPIKRNFPLEDSPIKWPRILKNEY